MNPDYIYLEVGEIIQPRDEGFNSSKRTWHPYTNEMIGKPSSIARSSRRRLVDPSPDPKGEAAAAKAPLHLVPSHPMHEAAFVFKLGAEKYGQANWRKNKVAASVYRSAMQRHLDAWFDCLEDADVESGRSHLAHVIASAAIVMDAAKHGTLVDDRPRQ